MGVEQFGRSIENTALSTDVSTTLTAKTANQKDDDINSGDVSNGDVVLNEESISGANFLVVAVTENSGNNVTATVEWTDGSGNVLYSQSPAALTDVNNGSDHGVFRVKSTHVKITFSGASTDFDASANAHG